MIFNVLWFFIFQINLINAFDLCGSDGWTQYKDEKCIKIFSQQIFSFKEAETFCILQNQEENNIQVKLTLGNSQAEPRLLTVTTAEEQKFIVEYLFKQNKVEKDVWLGARFDTTSKSFRWRANYNRQIEMGEKLIPVINKNGYTEKIFTNWQSGQPKTNANDQCVKMIASKDHQGQWIEVPCSEKNQVVCERNQFWSVSKVQQTLLKLEKTEANLQKKLQNTEIMLKKAIEEPTFPSNFIYVQFPYQQPPSKVFPWHQWVDVTDRYNGAFFRAEKSGSSENWEKMQEADTPYINRITRDWCELAGKGIGCKPQSKSWEYGVFPKPSSDIRLSPWKNNGVSDHVWTVRTYSEKDSPYYGDFIRFYYSNGEVRPKNYAIRIWQRK